MNTATLRVGAGVALLLAVALTSGASGQDRAAPAPEHPRGRLAADRLALLTRTYAALDARDLDGRRWTASRTRGRVIVVDFWATWCAPCLADIPWLRQARERFGPDRVEVLGVNLDVSDRRSLVSWFNRHRIDWPQLWDDRGYNGDLARHFEVTSLPTSLLVDPDGQVVGVNLRGERLLAAIGALLDSHASP